MGCPTSRRMREKWDCRGGMSKQEAIVIASRALALLMTVWALAEVSYLPGSIQSYVHYMYYESSSSTNLGYLQYMNIPI